MPKYKLNEAGTHIEMKDGHPVIIGDDDKEFTINAIGAASKISTITTESNVRRKKLVPLQTEIDGLKTKNTDLQTLVDAIGADGKTQIDQLKTELNSAWAEKETTWGTEKTAITKKLFNATIGAQFATSKEVAKLVLPPSIAQQTFASNFDPITGNAIDSAGNVIYSKHKPGEPAEFEEAIGILIATHPLHDSIVAHKGNGSGTPARSSLSEGSTDSTASENISAGLAELK